MRLLVCDRKCRDEAYLCLSLPALLWAFYPVFFFCEQKGIVAAARLFMLTSSRDVWCFGLPINAFYKVFRCPILLLASLARLRVLWNTPGGQPSWSLFLLVLMISALLSLSTGCIIWVLILVFQAQSPRTHPAFIFSLSWMALYAQVWTWCPYFQA